MSIPDGLLPLLDTRSFASLWYWLMLAIVWSLVTRGVLGVPPDVILAARRATGPAEAGDRPLTDKAAPNGLALLDWLSLTLPRLRLSGREGVVLLAVAAFALTVLALLGFTYGFELAQALTLLLAPLGLLAVLRLRLARAMLALLDRARAGEVPPAEAAATAARAMARARWLATGLSILAVAATAAWGTWWGLMHPNGG